ncbi:MAG TPA: hypothetical protein PLM53_05480 [Spirochaetota bacterium]|nr:hypothetical protein [Spirochaetota bacterium]HPC40522.1 hypothetical protein [Spirochaetota bacterium]HPL18409.1 hypothetical protein [Spirochaetota bacterium]HQF07970.1 hypothetical protein [Spirochaetota bacterium]HQH96530.1 hypothetical protein [Spirochaetota bacterium]
MKQCLAFALSFLMTAALITSCRMVEFSSRPRTISVEIVSDNRSQYQLSQLKVSGKFEPLKPAQPGIYAVSIPSMDGGYSEFLFIKYNKHIPEEYPVVQVIKDGKVLKELSISDMEKLPVKDGRSQLKPE